jgi:hypothetical protein
MRMQPSSQTGMKKPEEIEDIKMNIGEPPGFIMKNS